MPGLVLCFFALQTDYDINLTVEKQMPIQVVPGILSQLQPTFQQERPVEGWYRETRQR